MVVRVLIYLALDFSIRLMEAGPVDLTMIQGIDKSDIQTVLWMYASEENNPFVNGDTLTLN